MKAILVILAALIGTMVVIPAYSVVVELTSDKTSYKKGDQIVITGKTDAAHANNNVGIRIVDPNGKGAIFKETRSDIDGLFSTTIDTSVDKTSAKFAVKGIYNVTVFYSAEPQPQKIWKSTLFDYSIDGSPVSPSAAQIMAQQSQPSPAPTAPTIPTTPTQPTTPSPPTQPTTPTQPSTPTQLVPNCGTGTVLDPATNTCIIAPTAEPEPEPEPEAESAPQAEEPTGPKKTHIPGFPDTTKDPQSYIDRYNSEPAYKAWFDKNFPDDTIYDIVGVDEPAPAAACGPGTHDEHGVCVLDKKQGMGQCAIATAAFGSELAPQVQMLREVRDGALFGTHSGTTFMTGFNDFYYTFSPTIADWERQSPAFRELVRFAITPMLSTLSILQFAEIDSDQEMLGYGIGIILLNVGIYFVAPVIVILKTRKYLKF